MIKLDQIWCFSKKKLQFCPQVYNEFEEIDQNKILLQTI